MPVVLKWQETRAIKSEISGFEINYMMNMMLV